MKIFASNQIHELDEYTIKNEPIKSIDLMERAARALTNEIAYDWSASTPVVVFAGPGNNGGDALAVARMLAQLKYQIKVYLFNIRGTLSADCAENKRRLNDSKYKCEFYEVRDEFDPPELKEGMLVIDGLFGSGLDRPLQGGFASLVKYINASKADVVSIDVPSGLMTEDNSRNTRVNIIQADLTLTLGTQKLAFLFPETQEFLGELRILDIGLSREGIREMKTPYHIIEEDDIAKMLKRRKAFAHKGEMGHALLIAGAYGMAGAAVLAARACLRSGAGKVTVHTPKQNNSIIQNSVPEAIVQLDHDETAFSEAVDASPYQAIGIGPGLGQKENTAISVISQIRRTQSPIVVDADAINILASHQAWMQQLPEGIILTPHVRELERLVGKKGYDGYDRLQYARDTAQTHHCYVILKGHYSALCCPDGEVYFCPTGNAGMATAGSGDVLTGILTALLARGYNRQEACSLGIYIHGLAGDLASRDLGEESLIASDIISYLPKAFRQLYLKRNQITNEK